MKKFVFILIGCMFLLTGCQSNYQKKMRLVGEWEYRVSGLISGGWGDSYTYEFFTDDTVEYTECLQITLDANETCKNGSSIWRGKYTLKDNIITMKDFEVDESDLYNPTTKLSGPKKELIVDFDKMYFCNRDSGLDCTKKFEKLTDE